MALPVVNADGRTDCCDAYTTISPEDGVEYCKGCYREVGNPGPRFEFTLPVEEGEPDGE